MVDKRILALSVLVVAALVAAVYLRNPVIGIYLGIGFGAAIVALERDPYLQEVFNYHFNLGQMLVRRKGTMRRGAMDPRIGLGLAATFITAFIAMMVVATVEPETSASISNTSTLYQPYQTFTGYVGKSFSMWGLAIFVSVLGLVIGAIYAFWKS